MTSLLNLLNVQHAIDAVLFRTSHDNENSAGKLLEKENEMFSKYEMRMKELKKSRKNKRRRKLGEFVGGCEWTGRDDASL